MDDSAMKSSAGSNLPADRTASSAPRDNETTANRPTCTSIKKCVAFNPSVRYRVIEPFSALPPGEKSSIWYQEAEFEDIRMDIKRSARAMTKGRTEGTEMQRPCGPNPDLSRESRVYCYRGTFVIRNNPHAIDYILCAMQCFSLWHECLTLHLALHVSPFVCRHRAS
jgi:hypothetical protein